MAVPERLRGKVGKREIKISLGTSDATEAKIQQARQQAKWRSYFQALDREIENEAAAQAPTVVARFLEIMAERNGSLHNVIYGLRSFIASRLLLAWAEAEFEALNAYRALRLHPDPQLWEGGPAAQDADIIPVDAREEVVSRVDILHRDENLLGVGFAEAIEWLLAARRWDVVWPEVALVEEHTGISAPQGSLLFNTVAEALLHRLVEQQLSSEDAARLAALPRRYLPGKPEEYPPVSVPQPEQPAVSRRQPAAGKSGRPLSAGLRHWAQLRAPRPQSLVEARRAVDRFILLNGDLSVGQITRDDILDFRDFITGMPTNINLEKVKASGTPLRKAVEAALGKGHSETVRTLSPGAVKKDVGALGAILGLLKNEGWIPDNVSSGIPIAGYGKTRRGQRRPRLPLRPSMMQTLFASPLFTGCEGRADIERTRPGKHVYQDELYWSFLFGATSGPRLEEVGQIRLDDIEVIERPGEAPIVAIYVTGTGEGESIKNEESARVIVVHPRLLELGFLEYVKRRRAAGAARLFDLKQSPTGKWTKELSRRVNRYVDRVVTDDPRFVFHSLRHEFKDRAEATISTRVHDRITGHSPTTVGGRYGLGASVELIARELEKLDLSFVDWDQLRKAASIASVRERKAT
jgi:integrase